MAVSGWELAKSSINTLFSPSEEGLKDRDGSISEVLLPLLCLELKAVSLDLL
jgi:hypothetical protein